MGVYVDQTRERDQTAGLDGLVEALRGRVEGADLGDHAVADQDVLTTGTDQVGPGDQEVHD